MTRCPVGRWRDAALLMMVLLSAGSLVMAQDAASASVLETRHRLLEAVEADGAEAVPQLIEALEDEEPMVRRTAAHLIAHLGEAAREAFDDALNSDDVQVRHIVIDALSRTGLVDEHWPALLMDEAPSIQRRVQLVLLKAHPLPAGAALDRLMARLSSAYAEAPTDRRAQLVRLFTSFETITPAARRMLVEATRDPDAEIRETAYEGLLPHAERDWPAAPQLIERAMNDESEAVRWLGRSLRWKLLGVARVRLPREGWRFRTDPRDVGRDAQWYAPDHDDSDWRTDVPIETSWQNYIADGAYHGPAWYRRTIDVPAASDWDEALLHFGGVDEQAWVWVNGEFAGAHAEGPEGWNEPFVINATELIEPGEVNQITIRAQNTGGNGGIWQPVTLHVLDTNALAQ